MSAPPAYNPEWEQSYDSKYPPTNNSGTAPIAPDPLGSQMQSPSVLSYNGIYGGFSDAQQVNSYLKRLVSKNNQNTFDLSLTQ